jgi:hypothetical protein
VPLFGAWAVRPVLALAVAGQMLAVLLISVGVLAEVRSASN